MSFVLWLFEFGYILQHAATIFQIFRIKSRKSTEIISLDTNILFLIGALSRLVWMWDSMLKGFFLAYLEIIMAFISLVFIIFLYSKYKVNTLVTNEIRLPVFMRVQVLLPIVCVLSFFFHPGVKNNYYFTIQMFVSLSIFSEAIGLLPQWYIISKEKDTGNISQFYVVFLAFARLFRLLFWISMYYQGMKFGSLIVADLIHCAVLFNFVYNVIKNWNKALLPQFGEADKPKKMF
jgi:ER lumen protein retaining receptor